VSSVQHSRRIWKKNNARIYSRPYVAYGSHCELETQVLLSGDLGYIKVADMKRLQEEIGEVERMLKALIKSLERKVSKA
jgi:four helix bundle protein